MKKSSTPGPWIGFLRDGMIVAILPAGRNHTICEFSEPPTNENANLMIAAPDLLAALKVLSAGMSDARDSKPAVTAEEVRQARAAIDKAERQTK